VQDPEHAEGSADVCDPLREWALDHLDVPLEFPGEERCPQLVASDPRLDWAIELPAGSLPNGSDDCRFVLGFGKAGDTCCEGFVDASPPDPSLRSRRIIFPQCATPQIARIELIYCCP
jgi:hypothetical protein